MLKFSFLFALYCLLVKGQQDQNSISQSEIDEFSNMVPFMEISYLDQSSKSMKTAKVRFELFFKDCPKTCLNFAKILNGYTDEKGRNMAYKGSIFHRIIKNFMMQGGDFDRKNGTGGFSIYGQKFKDENFIHKHKKGVLSMANAGKNTNGSQFFITFVDTPHLDGHHVVFGKVLDSDISLIDAMQNVPTGIYDRPEPQVKVVNCGFEQKVAVL